MAIQSEISQVSYLGNGSTVTGYPVPFYFFEDTDLKVSRTDATGVVTQLSLGAQYSVSGAGSASGGSVTTATAYGGSDRITIARIVPATQPLVYDENDRFPAKAHERGLDRLTMLAQQVGRAAKRCFRLGDSQGEIPPIEARTPHTLAGLDGDGAPKLYTIDQLLTMLSLPAPVLNFPVKTWADDGGRAAAAPDFAGQPGTQQNNRTLWIASGSSAGAWTRIDPSAASLGASITALSETAIADGSWLLHVPPPFSTASKASASTLRAWLTRSGQTLQSAMATVAEKLSINKNIPTDDTIPEITEGGRVMICSLTPSDPANKLRVTFIGKFQSSWPMCCALFRQDTGFALDFTINSSSAYNQMCLRAEVPAGGTSSITFEVRAGRTGISTGELFVNGDTVSRIGGGAMKTTLLIEEIKA